MRKNCIAKHDERRVKTTLDYDESDPLAISITFHCGTRPPTWGIARDLMIAGLTSSEYVGEGDIRLRRIEADGTWLTQDQVELHLSCPNGEAFLLIPLIDLSRFLGRTLVKTPLGAEQADADELLTDVFKVSCHDLR